MPTSVPPFRAKRWLKGGHVQTLAGYFLWRRTTLPAPQEKLIDVAPGIRVRCCCYWQPDRRQAMTLLVVHGLEGSSNSHYMRGIATHGLATGMNVVLMNQRNCGGMNRHAPTLYNSGLSADVAAVAMTLIESEGLSRLALAGFSMGGNLVLKCAGEWAGQAPPQVKAVAAISPAMDLAACSDALHEPANRIYEWYFLTKLFRRFRSKAKYFPSVFDARRLRGVRSLRTFDDRITAFYGGYAGADDYYARAAAAKVVDRIAIPGLILHAANDPFIRVMPATVEKMAQNPQLTYMETTDGGHCAFIGEPDRPGDSGRWAEHAVVEFVRFTCRD